MAFLGSQEILLILATLVFVIIPVLVILGMLFIIFRNRKRVKELEDRVNRLEKASDRRIDGK